MRQPRPRVPLAQLRVELGAACDDERVDEWRFGPEQAAAAFGDAIAQRAATARRRIELTHASRDENAPVRLAEESARDDPGRAAVGGVAFGPPDGEGPAAGTAANVGVDDATGGRGRVSQLDNCGVCRRWVNPGLPARG